jgi:glycerophosphoryl diester phosphodiesterase
LTDKPPEFWEAVAIVGVVGALLVATLLRFISGWILVFPLVVFEHKLAFLAFGESARRMKGRRWNAIGVIVAWAAAAAAASWLVNTSAKVAGRSIAPMFGDSIAGLLAFVGSVAVVWGLASLAVNVASTTIYTMLVLRLYLEAGPKRELWQSVPSGERMHLGNPRFTLSFRALGGLLALALVAATGLAYWLLRTAWTERQVLVFAHRGASVDAPENTLAAFKLAGQEGTDYVELDVQETSDGVVVVAHDADLMKIGGSPLKIWESTFDQLRAVDIGSRVSPKFKDERLPTLAVALDACKGVCHVDIELKDYGHDQRLEERVAELVEAAGMEQQIVTMSLSAKMVAKMKQIRPAWTSGLLTAKAIGDLSKLPVDFLAVQSSMATRRFIRAAHAAGKPVYVWTIDDPHQMIRMIGLGVDGLITNRPAVAKDLLARFAAMPQQERLFLFVMTRLGAKNEISEDTHELRP